MTDTGPVVPQGPLTDEELARITRRGQTLFQIAMRMEVGESGTGDHKGGAEALLSLTDAIARLAAFSQNPRLSLSTATGLFDKIDGSWFARNNHDHVRFEPVGQVIADLAYEIAQESSPAGGDVGPIAARSLVHLIDAVLHIAALNSDPRRIIGLVVQALSLPNIEADIATIRKRQSS